MSLIEDIDSEIEAWSGVASSGQTVFAGQMTDLLRRCREALSAAEPKKKPMPLPDRDGQFVGEAFATDTHLVIAIDNGYTLDEDHNCDAMGCGQWHVLFRIPKSLLAAPETE